MPPQTGMNPSWAGGMAGGMDGMTGLMGEFVLIKGLFIPI